MWAIRMGFWRAPREGACAGRSRCADDGFRLMNFRSFPSLIFVLLLVSGCGGGTENQPSGHFGASFCHTYNRCPQ
jgi:hypothetical protein